MRIVSYFVVVLIVILGVGFACLNAEKVTVDLYLGTYHLHLSLLLVLTLGVGMVLGFLTMAGRYLRLKSENIRIKNRAKWVEKEVQNLRSIPLQDGP